MKRDGIYHGIWRGTGMYEPIIVWGGRFYGIYGYPIHDLKKAGLRIGVKAGPIPIWFNPRPIFK